MSLRAENVSKAFDGVKAVDGISLEFSDRGTTAIIGPNGAGKTTLIDILTGFQRADTGATFLGVVETTRLAPEKIARLGMSRTFQDVRIMWRESVLENVMVAVASESEGLLRAITRPRWIQKQEANIRSSALEALRVVGLEDRSEDTARELSYGQRKLLTLARCLAADVRWLILDEPVSGVSPAMVEDILSVIRVITNMDRAVVLIEHDIPAVRAVADVVVVLDRGRVIASGSAEGVLAREDVLEAYLG